MENAQFVDAEDAHRTTPWNKGKQTGAKPRLQPKHVWAIRTRLQIAGRTRDLAPLHRHQQQAPRLRRLFPYR